MLKKRLVLCIALLGMGKLFSMQLQPDNLYTTFHTLVFNADGQQTRWYPEKLDSLLKVEAVGMNLLAI